MKLAIVSIGFAAILGCAGPQRAPAATATDQRSLYERLGGRAAITAVVERFVARTGKDPRLEARFLNTDIPHLKAAMLDQISEGTGGPFKYSGKDMRTAHAGLNITEAEFAAFMEDLKTTLDEMKVPEREQREVLASFNALKADTVGH